MYLPGSSAGVNDASLPMLNVFALGNGDASIASSKLPIEIDVLRGRTHGVGHFRTVARFCVASTRDGIVT